MPRLSVSQNPSYRKHRSSGQAIVTLCGRDFYLGPYGSKASRDEYDRLIAQWRNAGRTLVFTGQQSGDLTVSELAAAFWEHAEQHYVDPEGKQTREIANYARVLKPLKALFGRTPIAEFGPIKLKAVRDKLVEGGLSRQTINGHIIRLRNVFRWGVENELVPAEVHLALKAVDGLRRGKTAARETCPVLPVEDAIVDRTMKHMPQIVADMVRVQRLTGARPEEVCLLRPCDVDRSSDVWLYRPIRHKTQHHGRERVIYLGPKAQDVLRAYLLRPADAFCFSPRESESKRRGEMHQRRRTPLGFGNRPGTNRKRTPKRTALERYTTNSYRRAIHRACEITFDMPIAMRYPARQRDESNEIISKEAQQQLQVQAAAWRELYCWSPNQLRHTAATEIRREFGLEAAQVVLGHSFADTTQIYAERDSKRGVEVMMRIG